MLSLAIFSVYVLFFSTVYMSGVPFQLLCHPHLAVGMTIVTSGRMLYRKGCCCLGLLACVLLLFCLEWLFILSFCFLHMDWDWTSRHVFKVIVISHVVQNKDIILNHSVINFGCWFFKVWLISFRVLFMRRKLYWFYHVLTYHVLFFLDVFCQDCSGSFARLQTAWLSLQWIFRTTPAGSSGTLFTCVCK